MDEKLRNEIVQRWQGQMPQRQIARRWAWPGRRCSR